MDQITVGLVRLPEVSRDNYSCWEDNLSVQVDMISGRRVIETRGKIWRVSWSYDYLDSATLRLLLAVLRSGAPFIATVLPDNSDEYVTSSFLTESLSPPTMAFSRRDRAYWHKISFALREETPHK